MISYTDTALFPLALQTTGVHYALIYSLIRSVSCNKQMFTLSHSHTRRSGNVRVIQLSFFLRHICFCHCHTTKIKMFIVNSNCHRAPVSWDSSDPAALDRVQGLVVFLHIKRFFHRHEILSKNAVLNENTAVYLCRACQWRCNAAAEKTEGEIM